MEETGVLMGIKFSFGPGTNPARALHKACQQQAAAAIHAPLRLMKFKHRSDTGSRALVRCMKETMFSAKGYMQALMLGA